MSIAIVDHLRPLIVACVESFDRLAGQRDQLIRALVGSGK